MPVNIALAYHSNNIDDVNKIIDGIKQIRIEPFLISESTPVALHARSTIIQKSSLVIIIASRKFQNDMSCMELLNYAKDLKKKIIMINPNKTYRPFGSLGAIGASSELGVLQVNDDLLLDIGIEKILNYLSNQRPKSMKILADTADENKEDIKLTHSNINANVLISYHSEAKATFDLIKEALNNKKINFIGEECSSGKTSILTSQLLVVLMSSKYEESDYGLLIVETARSKKKPIIPISISKSFKPDKWLGLVIAGKLYYRLFSKEEAYKHFYDSTPMNNFIYSIEAGLSLANLGNRDEIEIASLKKRIDECKSKLPSTNWEQKSIKSINFNLEPVKITLKEPKADHYMHYIHTEVTRLDFKPPIIHYDAFGVPMRVKYDCMISYQWDFQDLVRDMYTDLYTRSLKIWFDIWGGMEGNSNDSMATAIESSKIVAVFLSDSYQKSPNCKLELSYAVYCGKPILFVIVQPVFQIEPWIQDIIKSNYKFEVFSLSDLAVMTNNMSKLDIIAQSIRDIGAAQPDNNDIYETNEDVYNLKVELNDLLNEISKNTGKERFKACTRCKKQYEIDNPVGCKKHRLYFCGGTLIAGRWMCCNQQDKNSIGCENAEFHTDKELKWALDENYGTYTWK